MIYNNTIRDLNFDRVRILRWFDVYSLATAVKGSFCECIMGISSSKTKSNNVTLVKSKCSDEEFTNDPTTTPLRKVLPFDPRSPTEHFSRTPIVVTANQSDTPAGPATPANVKVLEVDPRSPSQQVSRTPIIVEKSTSSSTDTPKSGGVRTRPHALHTPDKALQSTEENDPRSPSVTVPRTPLEQKLFEVSIHNVSSSSDTKNDNTGTPEDKSVNEEESGDMCDVDDASREEMEKENQPETSTSRAEKQSKESSASLGSRSPLSSNNRNCSTPRNLLQAKQCRTLEEEFNKNQRNILAQIAATDEEEAIVPSTTQFVDQI
ncbi:hypothetical protein FHG87_003794 [Trinorchestia longiramus]|nr:hypothetical protein FHG87_003794 [Trinorchestia longiramus]